MFEENVIKITELNDFIFCPASIYFHRLYGKMDNILYNGEKQTKGLMIHNKVDNKEYSTSKEVITSLEVFSDEFMLFGKIDILDLKTKTLIERKNKVKEIYDGYIFQLYAQYFCLIEMGYEVEKLKIYSFEDNKNYFIKLPNEDKENFNKFLKVINDIRNFRIEKFEQKNIEKCRNCIYESCCDRSLL